MKKVQLFNSIESFEKFINRTDIEIIQVEVKVVEQSYMFQEYFAAVVFYRMLLNTLDNLPPNRNEQPK